MSCFPAPTFASTACAQARRSSKRAASPAHSSSTATRPQTATTSAIRKDIADFFGAFPDLNFTLRTAVESGDTVAFEGTGKGTQKGPMAGPAGEIPATNRPMEVRFAAFLRVNDQGLIAEERRYFDMAGMMQQLGIMS